ncbi:hypothetical protein SPF06_02440 [Sinomonas sp. JGH33]|uniref:Lipoprotein n=1 Tax=Sinomonas terricola TaxID=3110330 RepID=A0ABU5T1P4_9MICC|nr:hypothetical protein [Sinomonas sp. JGH33]MEA5453571.1 hypothetical protein [Sinomonas sp. JGH33]
MRRPVVLGAAALTTPLAAVLAAVVAGCGAETQAPEPSASKGTSMSADCQHTGAYKLVPSVNGSYPLLPTSPRGAAATPRVRMVSAKPHATPPTLDVSITADDPALGGPKEFAGLTVGSAAEFGGYTVRVTDICDGEAWFDVVSHP